MKMARSKMIANSPRTFEKSTGDEPMSDLALQLIAENKRSRATFLDLGNCGLTEVPAEVGELVWLESLSLASEWAEWDGRAWQEKKSRNTGDKNNRLIDIGPLGGLAGLRSV